MVRQEERGGSACGGVVLLQFCVAMMLMLKSYFHCLRTKKFYRFNTNRKRGAIVQLLPGMAGGCK
jgi:hypothetical protein